MSAGVEDTDPGCLSLAIAFQHAPGRFPELQQGEGALPDGIVHLLRLAGGAPISEEMGAPPLIPAEALQSAAIFFIERALLAHSADHYRILGVSPDAPLDQIKEHHRLLIRLFHPDRSVQFGGDSAAIAARINLAYNAVRQSEPRAAYDIQLRQGTKESAPINVPMQRDADLDRMPLTPRLPPFLARHLPQFVLAGVAVFASLGVGLVYVTREPSGAIGGGGFERSASREARAPVPPRQVPVAPKIEPDVSPRVTERPMSEPAREVAPRPAPGIRPIADAPPIRAAARSQPDGPPQLQVTRALDRPEPRPSASKGMVTSAVAAPVSETAVRAAAPPQPPAAPAVTDVAQPSAPAGPAQVAVVSPPPVPTISNRDALAALVVQLSALYRRGDLEGFLALFDDNAHIEGGGKARIRTDYDALFRGTRARELRIADLQWVRDGEVFRGEGSFQARVVRQGEDTERTYQGIIRLEAIAGNGTARLRGMFH